MKKHVILTSLILALIGISMLSPLSCSVTPGKADDVFLRHPPGRTMNGFHIFFIKALFDKFFPADSSASGPSGISFLIKKKRLIVTSKYPKIVLKMLRQALSAPAADLLSCTHIPAFRSADLSFYDSYKGDLLFSGTSPPTPA